MVVVLFVVVVGRARAPALIRVRSMKEGRCMVTMMTSVKGGKKW